MFQLLVRILCFPVKIKKKKKTLFLCLIEVHDNEVESMNKVSQVLIEPSTYSRTWC